jgi:magnesium transporter
VQDDAPPSSRSSSSYRALPSESPHSAPELLRTSAQGRSRVFLVHFDAEELVERELRDLDECLPFLEGDGITWVDVRGLGDTALFARLGEIFALHPLALEDCINVPQRPKTDIYPEHQVFITRMVSLEGERLVSEQHSIVFGRRWVVTVQEEPDVDCLEPLRRRIRENRGIIRKSGADYLAYALFDAVIDGFYPVLEHFGELLDAMEERVVEPTRTSSQEIFAMKRELLQLRRAIWPQRDLLAQLLRDESPHIRPEARPYFRDTYDHAIQVMDMVETFREIASSLMDLLMNGVSNRLNEVMKVLTILSTVFLPMTFVAGVYGMNFDTEKPWNMPELKWAFGYPFALFMMVLSAGSLLFYYWRKGWIGTPPSLRRSHKKKAARRLRASG